MRGLDWSETRPVILRLVSPMNVEASELAKALVTSPGQSQPIMMFSAPPMRGMASVVVPILGTIAPVWYVDHGRPWPMQGIHLDPPEWHWECPSCRRQYVSHELRPHTPMHPCGEHSGFEMPYARVEAGAAGLGKHAVIHKVIEREDWIGQEHGIPIVGGTAVMAVRTERADGSYDTHIFAPVAKADARGWS